MNPLASQALGPPFALADELRRTQAAGLAALGFGPAECRHRIVASGGLWRLRHYAGSGGGPAVVIVAAPIKRPYIWDLAPSASAVRYCLRQDLNVYLLEWRPPSHRRAIGDLADYAEQALGEAVAAAAKALGGAKPFLMGHSLGGTMAAIFAALHPERLAGLVLLSAPLCLAPGTSPFRDALVALAPTRWQEMDIVPGSLVSQLSIMASPATFLWSRLLDATVSAGDPRASDLRSRIEHWALDEVPLSGRLLEEILVWLYREDRFCRGRLAIRGRTIGPRDARLPALAVANAADQVAPPAAVRPFLQAMPGASARFIAYPGEAGVSLQHVAILVGRAAYDRIWPEIVAWIKAEGAALPA